MQIKILSERICMYEKLTDDISVFQTPDEETFALSIGQDRDGINEMTLCLLNDGRLGWILSVYVR